jgi:hypothetical protein
VLSPITPFITPANYIIHLTLAQKGVKKKLRQVCKEAVDNFLPFSIRVVVGVFNEKESGKVITCF